MFAPKTSFEKAFYPDNNFSKTSVNWLEDEAKKRKIHIHHALCGHGGERWILGKPVDGFHPETKTVFQFHGCYWHGCLKCFPEERDKIVNKKGETLDDKLKQTTQRTEELKKAGYNVIETFYCDAKPQKTKAKLKETKTYPHAILYDFKAYGNNNQRKEPTKFLTIKNEHVPISVSVGDTLEKEPTHICEKNPGTLIKKFIVELERRAKNIRNEVKKTFIPSDINLLTKNTREKIYEWCEQVPVVGFNSGGYDLNLIKNCFVEHLSDTTNKVRVAKNGHKIMFLLTKGFRFLDIINYLGPGTSYEKWVKAYECSSEKSWFPYEWFDSVEKLDFPGLPDYPFWYSSLKEEYLLKISQWKACKKSF